MGCFNKQSTTTIKPEANQSEMEPSTAPETPMDWIVQPLSLEQFSAETNVQYTIGEYETTITIGTEEQFFEAFTFQRYQKGQQKHYLITGTGTGGTNITLYHTILSHPNIVAGSFVSLISPILLNETDLTFSLGYVDGKENVVTIKDGIVLKENNSQRNTNIPISDSMCRSLLDESNNCIDGDIGSLSEEPGCPSNHDDYVLGSYYTEIYEIAKAHSTFHYQKQQEYCISLCNDSTPMLYPDYKKTVCGLMD